MNTILGLDIGTNSIGWVLLRENQILDRGVNVFPIGTNLIKGVQEETKNHQRGGYRRAKRNLFRYKLRRKQLKKLLQPLGFLPDFSESNKVKKTYQASLLYELRAKALNTQIPAKEIGRIFLLINKHRGFKSNSKAIIELDETVQKEEGKVKDGISQLERLMLENKAKTVGEYFHKMYEKALNLYNEGKWHNIDEPYDERAINEEGEFNLQNNRGIRRENGRYVARAMYEKEFDLIWDKQKEYYPQLTGSRKEYDEICLLPIEEKRICLKTFKETLYWKIKSETIFYQRGLRSQKKFIGKCNYESTKRTAPISSPLFQEFRILKQLADVRYSDKENDFYNQSLPSEWRLKLVDYLNCNSKLNLREGKKKKDGTKTIDIMDVLGLSKKKNYEFNFDNTDDDKTFEGNKTYYAIHNACGEELFMKLKSENKLEKLWHILYMAKDDEWLKDTLLFSWGFSETIALKLIEMGLEDGFASYSSKVLKKIMPFMREGKDEFDSKVLAGYEKAPDEVKDAIILSPKIRQLKNNELRNPVVEKAISQAIKLVNAVIQNSNYAINQEKFTIRIESTREFKKPKTEREKIRRGNTETDKKREALAAFLNEKRKNNSLSVNREIYKNDSIISKFELWLEMGMDKEDATFNSFRLEGKASEKHKLWLECNRICPYSGKIIPLSKLFTSEVEIEHIIPYSRSLDDSFTNKTLTFSDINKKKANKTAFEFIKDQGEIAFKEFKARINSFENKQKIKGRFLLENVASDFSNAQLNNTSYIAKYVRKKLQEVCRDVQFTNGSATGELRKNDWQLGNLLDKIRYEEETGINIDAYISEFNVYKKDFEVWRRKKNNSTDLQRVNWKELDTDVVAEYEQESKNPITDWWRAIRKFDDFRSAKGKKDRSDHRHHLLDAIITSCCSRNIIQQLSTLNATREQQGISLYDEKGRLTRAKIECPLSYDQIKSALKDNLIYHQSEKRLLTSKINKTKKLKDSKSDSSFNKKKTYSVRGSLVGDNFYGKLKNPRHQGFDKDTVFVKRVSLNGQEFKNIKSLDKIIDLNVREVLKRRLENPLYADNGEKAFSDEALLKDPVYLYSVNKYPSGIPVAPLSNAGKPLPIIKKVRIANKNARNLIQLPAKSEDRGVDGKRKIISQNRYAETDGNYVMALYEGKDEEKKGKVKTKRDFEILSFFEAVRRKEQGEKLFPDEKLQKDGSSISLLKGCPYLKQGDMVVLYENQETEINWDDLRDLKKRLYRVSQLSSKIVSKIYEFGDIFLVKHNVTSANAKYESVSFSLNEEIKHIQNSHVQFKGIKVKLNNLGRITKTWND